MPFVLKLLQDIYIFIYMIRAIFELYQNWHLAKNAQICPIVGVKVIYALGPA